MGVKLKIWGQVVVNAILLVGFYLIPLLKGQGNFFTVLLYVVASTAIIWECLQFMAHLAQKIYPSFSKIRKRLLLMLCFVFFIAAFVPFVKFTLSVFLGVPLSIESHVPPIVTGSGSFWQNYLFLWAQNFFYCFVIAAMYETMFSLSQWQQLLRESEELKRENLLTRFNSLSEQVNPHFLFNSLNTVLSLISQSPKQAEIFVEELATVYRYVLRANQQNIVLLRAELGFLHSYIHLLKSRFDAALDIHIQIDKDLLDLYIPPLTLQILVENAIKHNKIETQHPLSISIYSQGDSIIVSNLVNRKAQDEPSEKTGLKNIISRYRLLHQQHPQVITSAKEFRVIVSLIKAGEE